MLTTAQQFFTRTYTIDDGLPSNQVNCLYQDSTGYLWVGTDAGVGIYDGSDFKIINRKDGLASNDVRAITKDEGGALWFACYDGGLTKYEDGIFISYAKKDGLHSNYIRRLYYSKTYKTLFVGADDGFYTLKDGKFTFYGKANGKLEEEHEILWFMEGKGFVYVFPYFTNLLKFYPESGKITQQFGEKNEKGRWFSLTSAMVTSKQDTVWGDKFSITNATGFYKLGSTNSGLVFGICEGENGQVWLPIWGSQASGIVRFDGSSFEDYTARLGLEGIRCNSVSFDKNAGILWVATDGKGLTSFPRRIFTCSPLADICSGKHEYKKLFNYRGSPCLLYKDQIVQFNASGSPTVIPISILENSDAGAMIRNIKLKLKKDIPIPNSELCRLPEFYDVAKDSQSNFWISTTVGFYRFSPDLKTITKALPFDFRYGQIEFDLQDNLYNWGYWLNNLDIIPAPNAQKEPYVFHKYSNRNSELPKEITQMLPIGKNMLFSSLYGGLYLCDDKTFIHLNNAYPKLPDNVSDICKDHEGNIVYCTNTGEIGIGTVENGEFNIKKQFDSLDQSYGRNFLWVICDQLYNIYVGTNKGLLVIHYPPVYSSIARNIRFFSNSEGYKDLGVSNPILDDDGNVWLASQDNLVMIDPKAMTTLSSFSPKISLTKLETTDSTYDFTVGSGLSGITAKKVDWKFPYRSNNLTFFINSINLLNPEKDRFFVQLEGFDPNFKDVGSDRKAVYTNLPAGKYKFTVKVFNLNTLQRQSQTLIEFTIKPPYWQTWWFYLVVGIIIIFILWMVYNARVKRIRKETKAQLEVAELEMQALQSQMNPHFVFNVMNSLQRYILERDAKKGIQLLGDFSSMIRQTFSLASKKVITLQEEITYLDSYLKLEQERFAQKFQYEITTDPSLNLNDVLIPSMLIQPMVENAVKHGLSPLEGIEGMLRVVFSKLDEQSLKCAIEDNGIGLEKSLAAKRDNTTRLSKALSITQRRIELFNHSSKAGLYSVKVTDRGKLQPDQRGTVVEIILPIQID